MRILVVGATGFVGRRLLEALRAAGHEVLALSRHPDAARRALPGVEVPEVNPQDAASVAVVLARVDGIVNLAGDSIAEGRWTEAKKSRIRESRVQSVRALGRALSFAAVKPKVLVNASAVGIYGPRAGDTPLGEGDEGAPTDFLGQVCRAWESEALALADRTRVAIVRFGVVLGKGGGALEKMLPPFKMFVGGPIGGGKQWMSWVHVDDAAGIVLHALAHDVAGPVNAVAPDARTNGDFSRTLAKVLGRPCLFPVPPFALRLAFGEMADMLLTGQRVVPRRAQELGYAFVYPELEGALRAILAR